MRWAFPLPTWGISYPAKLSVCSATQRRTGLNPNSGLEGKNHAKPKAPSIARRDPTKSRSRPPGVSGMGQAATEGKCWDESWEIRVPL